jgi:hypothetical protein
LVPCIFCVKLTLLFFCSFLVCQKVVSSIHLLIYLSRY